MVKRKKNTILHKILHRIINRPVTEKIAILVIASLQQKHYILYLNNYWKKMIEYTNSNTPNVDIFLLFDHGLDLTKYSDITKNIIIDNNENYNDYFPKGLKCEDFIPGILSKTIYGLNILQNKYDVFFRTNLSSMVCIKNIIKYVEKHNIIYSGFYIWKDTLRKDLIDHNKIGKNKSIKNLEELVDYPGNTFISGSGYFLNKNEVSQIIREEKKIRYDIIDDVSIGLMLRNHECISGKYHYKICSSFNEDSIISKIKHKVKGGVFHIRLEHFNSKETKNFHNFVEKYDLLKIFH
jgi:hypothetical protein